MDTLRSAAEERLKSSWEAERAPFASWVRSVAEAHTEGGLTLEAAASLVEATPAEFEAVLQLALLGDEELASFPDAPPKTTWFLFAGASEDGIRAGITALESRGGRSAFEAVKEAIHEVQGPSEQERVASLPWQAFAHMAKKAKQYKQLRDKDRNALKSFSTRKKGGRPLTGAQVAYATGLLTTLAEAGAISRESMDGDQEICDQVLDALGLR